jgi:methyl-accepting chemotaxis protein
MQIKYKFPLLTAGSIILLSLILISIGIWKFTDEVNKLNTELYAERISKHLKLAQDQDDLFFEGKYDNENEPKERTIDKFRNIYRADPNQEIYPFIIDNDGVVIAHPALSRGDLSLKEMVFIKQMLEKKNGELLYLYNNEDKWMLFQTYDPWQWTFGYAVPLHLKNQGISAFIGFAFITGIICILIFCSAIFIIFNTSIKPLKEATHLLAIVSEGEGDLTKRLKTTTRDEVGELANYFNKFIEKLRLIITNLKSVGAKSKEIGNNLASGSEEVSSTLEEISQTMHTISNSVTTMSTEVEESHKSAQSINQFISDVVEQIQEQSAGVNESSAAITQMLANIRNIDTITKEKKQLTDQLANMAQQGETGMKNVVASIEEINKSTTVIVEMIRVINEVASQTNLLAMNAAIEAAHAGQYGKGFSVVADEIRKLAETTSTNVKSISNSLKQMTKQITSTAVITKESNLTISKIIQGTQEVSDSITEMSDGLKELTSGSHQITTALSSLTGITENVRAASGKMVAKTQEIVESMNRISGVSHNNMDGMNEISTGINEILKAILLVAELSTENAQNISILENEIMRFKTD